MITHIPLLTVIRCPFKAGKTNFEGMWAELPFRLSHVSNSSLVQGKAQELVEGLNLPYQL